MKHKILFALAITALVAGAASARADAVQYSGTPGVTLYSLPGFAGRQVLLRADTPKLKKLGFAARAMSMKVAGGRWKVCDGNRYSGTCEVFGPGNYTFAVFHWAGKIKSVRRFRPGTPVITLFARPGMNGEHHSWAGSVPRLKDFATNDFAQSAKVTGGAWVLCEDSQGKGRCETVRGDIPDLNAIGLAGAVSSLYRASEWPADRFDDGSGGGSGYGYDDSGYARTNDGRGFDGERTVFFVSPQWRGQPVASALYRHSGDAQAAANAFCRSNGLRQAVYFDEARSYAAPVFLGNRQRARQGGQRRLVDVLCLR